MPIRPENRPLYAPDWPQISRRIRFDRAQGRCECAGQCGHDHGGRCTARNGDATKSGGPVVLTVAHLDHDPQHNAPENLLAACQACHLRYDAEHHRQTAAATRRAAIEATGQLTFADTAPET
jgi:hypothetical protein